MLWFRRPFVNNPPPSIDLTGLCDGTPAAPLQSKLNALAELIATIGSLVTLIVVTVPEGVMNTSVGTFYVFTHGTGV